MFPPHADTSWITVWLYSIQQHMFTSEATLNTTIPPWWHDWLPLLHLSEQNLLVLRYIKNRSRHVNNTYFYGVIFRNKHATFIIIQQILINITRCNGRVVKVLDLWSGGVSPRRFKSYLQRVFISRKPGSNSLKTSNTYSQKYLTSSLQWFTHMVS